MALVPRLAKYAIPIPLLLLFLTWSADALAQSGDGKSPPFNGSPRLSELQAEGSDALFNLDYDVARLKFKEIGNLFPDDPTGPEMLASTLWLEAVSRARRSQAAIYSTQTFSAEPDDKPDARQVNDFHDLTRQATQLANAGLRRNPHDPKMLHLLGSTETLKAAFAATVERHFMTALVSGSNGVQTERDVLKLDPNFHDAELSIGMYDYIVATLPLPARIVAGMTGVHGSKKRGIQTLERVANQGQSARPQARILLISIYKKDGRFQDALALSRELQESYPRNYLFRLETADALVSQAAIYRQSGNPKDADAMEGEALSIFQALLHERPAHGPGSRALDLVHFRYGESLLAMRQPQRAATEFLAATTVSGADVSTVSRAHLRAAQALDLAGKRNEALAEYRIVLTRPKVSDLHDQARRGQQQPYKEPPRTAPK